MIHPQQIKDRIRNSLTNIIFLYRKTDWEPTTYVCNGLEIIFIVFAHGRRQDVVYEKPSDVR